MIGDVGGPVGSGDHIRIIKDGKILVREIGGVEFARTTSKEKIGILINCETEEEKLEIRNWEVDGKEFEIVKSTGRDAV